MRDETARTECAPCGKFIVVNVVKIEVYRVSNRVRFPKESCIIVLNRGKNKESFFPVEQEEPE